MDRRSAEALTGYQARLAGVCSYEGARWAIPSIWRSPITPRTEGNMSAKIDHIHVVLPAAGGRSDERLTIGRTAELDHDAAPHPPPPAVRRRTRPSRRPARPARTCHPLSRCSIGSPSSAPVLVTGPVQFTLVQLDAIGLWSALMSAASPASPVSAAPRSRGQSVSTRSHIAEGSLYRQPPRKHEFGYDLSRGLGTDTAPEQARPCR